MESVGVRVRIVTRHLTLYPPPPSPRARVLSPLPPSPPLSPPNQVLQVQPTGVETATILATSQMTLALKAYRNGQGATPDLEKAVGLYTLATQCGVPEISMKASHELGMA